jgi:glycosyltransferase involved in cell wall biosynthesis
MEDIREAYQKGSVFVAPMTMGSGMQNKILEALSMGLPVVCTDTAADAFEIQLKNELIVANDDAEIAHLIVEIFENPNAHSPQKAIEIIQSQFSWKKATEPLLSLLSS